MDRYIRAFSAAAILGGITALLRPVDRYWFHDTLWVGWYLIALCAMVVVPVTVALFDKRRVR